MWVPPSIPHTGANKVFTKTASTTTRPSSLPFRSARKSQLTIVGSSPLERSQTSQTGSATMNQMHYDTHGKVMVSVIGPRVGISQEKSSTGWIRPWQSTNSSRLRTL